MSLLCPSHPHTESGRVRRGVPITPTYREWTGQKRGAHHTHIQRLDGSEEGCPSHPHTEAGRLDEGCQSHPHTEAGVLFYITVCVFDVGFAERYDIKYHQTKEKLKRREYIYIFKVNSEDKKCKLGFWNDWLEHESYAEKNAHFLEHVLLN